jgi:hypothetical protein
MSYVPKVNDYVRWNKEKHCVEGWVYFMDNSYLTIEIQTKPKHPEDIPYGTHHKKERTLVVCYPESWSQLSYVRSRNCVYEEK